ncbi:hypothetical protein ICG_06028 [Bacillus cereus BAG1X1-3]|nr:hypothetical protein ICG_06028 [Bacillus cereus BAG1X1-3]
MNIHFEDLNKRFEVLFGRNSFQRFHTFVKDQRIHNIDFHSIEPEHVNDWINMQSTEIITRVNFLRNSKRPFEMLINEFRLAYLYWLSGKRHFHIEDDLANKLVQTDIHKVNSSFLKLPFPVVYFTVPEDLVGVEFLDDNDECLYRTIAQGAYVSEVQEDNKKQWWIAMFLKVQKTATGNPNHGEISIWIRLPILDNENIFDSLTTVLDEYFPKNSITVDAADYYLNRNSRVIAEQFSILIINTLLYLQSDKAILEHVGEPTGDHKNKKVKKKEKRNKKSLSTSYIRIGKKVTIDNKHKQIYREFNHLKDQPRKRREFNGQWIVRGHWRNQPYGEGLSKRKLIWIEPYVKGVGELAETEYLIK